MSGQGAKGGHGGGGGEAKGSPMTSDAAARIQSSEAKAGGVCVESGGFPARAQAAAAHNEAAGKGSSKK